MTPNTLSFGLIDILLPVSWLQIRYSLGACFIKALTLCFAVSNSRADSNHKTEPRGSTLNISNGVIMWHSELARIGKQDCRPKVVTESHQRRDRKYQARECKRNLSFRGRGYFASPARLYEKIRGLSPQDNRQFSQRPGAFCGRREFSLCHQRAAAAAAGYIDG
jgi:hypothetical protein